MEKNQSKNIIRIVLYALAAVILGVYFFVSKGKQNNQTASPASQIQSVSNSTAPAVLEALSPTVTVPVTIASEDGSISAIFDIGGAQELSIDGSWNRLENPILVSAPAGQARPFDFMIGSYSDLITNGTRPSYHLSNLSSSSLQMSAEVPVSNTRLLIVRKIFFKPKGVAQEQLLISNLGSENVLLDSNQLAFTFASLYDFANLSVVEGKKSGQNVLTMRWNDGQKIKKADFKYPSVFGLNGGMAFAENPEWLSLSDNFFLSVVRPNFQNTYGLYNSFDNTRKRIAYAVQVLATNIPAGGNISMELDYYIGPNHENALPPFVQNGKKLFAWWPVFNIIMKPIEKATSWIIAQLFVLIPNAGLILILIALLLKLVLLPLSLKAAISMKKMRLLQPKIQKLQEKYGSDQTLLQQKTMSLYKEEKVNPLGGCFPLLLQMPVFFILYRVLSRSVELRGAGFLWIRDLTAPDSLFMLGSFNFNLLPIIMSALQLLTTYLQQGRVQAGESEMQKQMQIQAYLMPVVFLFLFWNMPSGLVLYWTAQNVFSIIEQECINKSHKGEKQKNY